VGIEVNGETVIVGSPALPRLANVPPGCAGIVGQALERPSPAATLPEPSAHTEAVLQNPVNARAKALHPRGVGDEDNAGQSPGGLEAIHNQPRQTIRLTMNPPKGPPPNTRPAPQLERGLQPPFEQSIIHSHGLVTGEETGCNEGVRVRIAAAHESSATVHQLDRIPRDKGVWKILKLVAEDPGMPAKNPVAPTRPQDKAVLAIQ